MSTASPLDLCDRVLEMVARREPEAEAEVTVSDGRHGLTRFANSFVHQNVAEDHLAVLLRVVLDGRVASSSTTAADDDGLARLVDGALDAARLRPVDPDWPGLAPASAVPAVEHYDPETAEAAPAARAALVRDFVEAGPGLRAAGYCDTEGGTTAFANSGGQRVAGRSTRATLDGIHQADAPGHTSAGQAHQTSQRIGDLDGLAAGEVAARLARESADTVELEPGRYEVILGPECVAEMLAFLAAYGFNAKQVIEEQSFVRLGERQFDEAITLVDDATDPRAIGVAFDVEGTPKRRVELVGAGVTVGLAHDRRTARRAGTESTGHAIPGGESFGAFPTNLFLAPGHRPFEELVAAVGRGLLVTEFNYCRVLDPKTLVVTGLTRNGTFLVEDGKVTNAVANLRFTQSFSEALAPGAVRGVGADARFAEAEFGVGMVVAPALHLASWNFTGGARG